MSNGLIQSEDIDDLVYLVGYWMGRGIESYDAFYDGLTLGDNTSFVRREVAHPFLILRYPWHFIAGFLDSGGSVGCKSNRAIEIRFHNKNQHYLGLLGIILDRVNIPWSLQGQESSVLQAEVSKLSTLRSVEDDTSSQRIPYYFVRIETNSGAYLMCTKVKSLLSYSEKVLLMKDYIEFYRETNLRKKLPLVETFFSVQGEGCNIGLPQYFIRVAGCNLKCINCDSYFALGSGTERTLEEIVQEVIISGVQSICLTGGEFLKYRNRCQALIAFLREHDFHIVLQTNGTRYDTAIFSLVDTVAMDIKTPCTGTQSDEGIISKLRPGKDEIKTLISNDEDYEFALRVNKQASFVGVKQILQPLDDVGKDTTESLTTKLRWLAEKVLADSRWDYNSIKVLPQLHKMIWGSQVRGV